jgi:hypothetical protein
VPAFGFSSAATAGRAQAKANRAARKTRGIILASSDGYPSHQG